MSEIVKINPKPFKFNVGEKVVLANESQRFTLSPTTEGVYKVTDREIALETNLLNENELEVECQNRYTLQNVNYPSVIIDDFEDHIEHRHALMNIRRTGWKYEIGDDVFIKRKNDKEPLLYTITENVINIPHDDFINTANGIYVYPNFMMTPCYFGTIEHKDETTEYDVIVFDNDVISLASEWDQEKYFND